MQKLVSFVLAVMLAFGLVGCSSGGGDETSDSDNPPVESQKPLASKEEVENEFLHNGVFYTSVEDISFSDGMYNLTVSFVGEDARQSDPNICAYDIDRLINKIHENNEWIFNSLGIVTFNCPSESANYQTGVQIQNYTDFDGMTFIDTLNNQAESITVTKDGVEAACAKVQTELDAWLAQERILNIGDCLYEDRKISISYSGSVKYETVYAPDGLNMPKAAIVFSVSNATGESLAIVFNNLYVNNESSGYTVSHSLLPGENDDVEIRFDALPDHVGTIHADGFIMFDDYETSDFKF